MSDELRPTNAFVVTPAIVKNPLLALPEAWWGPVTKFIAAKSYLISDQLGFCVEMRALIDDYGLCLEDARVILLKLNSPQFAMEWRFPAELHADLNRLAYHAIDRRRRQRQAALEREGRERPESAAGVAMRLADSLPRIPQPAARPARRRG